MMRVLVLGANGFVGARLVQALAQSGWAVPVAAGRRPLTGQSVRSIQLDAEDQGQIERALGDADAAVNCVAGDAETIVRNAGALFGAAAKLRRHVIFLSSIAVYGSAAGRVVEDSPLLGNEAGGYAAAKVHAEQLAAGDVTIFRPGCIYGMGSPQWTERIAWLLKARRIGDLGAAGAGYSNLVHIWDVVAAVEAALQQGSSGVRAFNLAMPGAPDWNEYFRRFADALGAGPVARVPQWRLQLEAKALAAPLRVLEKVTGRAAPRVRIPPAITPSLVRLWRQDMRVESGRASSELGLSWTGLEAGLAEAVAAGRSVPIWRKA